jgi:hypothetical protein
MRLSSCALACLTLVAAGTAIAAEPRHMTASGASLKIDGPCARHVSIQPDPTLNGQVAVDATADNPQEIAQLALNSDDGAKLFTPADRCWRPDGSWNFEPTLTLTIRVPPHFPINIDESNGNYTIGPVAGPLAADLSGSIQLHADSVTTLAVDMSGSGQVTIGQADGTVHADMSGSGTIDIGTGTLPDLTLDMSGSGRFRLGAGSIAKLRLETDGSGQVQIGGTVGDGTISISGSGSVNIAKVTGQLRQDVSGSGSVQIGSR